MEAVETSPQAASDPVCMATEDNDVCMVTEDNVVCMVSEEGGLCSCKQRTTKGYAAFSANSFTECCHISVVNFTGKVRSPDGSNVYEPDGKLAARQDELATDFGFAQADGSFTTKLEQDLDGVLEAGSVYPFDQDEAASWRDGTHLHIIFFHHESYEPCDDGFLGMLMYYLSLRFLGVPESSISVFPFDREFKHCEAAWFQADDSKHVHFHFVDALPPRSSLSAEMVDWFNEKISSKRLKVWVMDHHREQALGFAKWIPCTAFHPGKTTQHSKEWPIAAGGSEPSSWTSYHLLQSLRSASFRSEEISFDGVSYKFDDLIAFWKLPAAMAAFSDMVLFATEQEIQMFAQEHLLTHFDNNSGALDAAMLFQDSMLQNKKGLAAGSVFADQKKIETFANELGALATFSNEYLKHALTNVQPQYQHLITLAKRLQANKFGIICGDDVNHLLEESRSQASSESTDDSMYPRKAINYIEYLQKLQRVALDTAKTVAESMKKNVRVKVDGYTVCLVESNPSTSGRLFTKWLPLYLDEQGIKVKEDAVLILFLGCNLPDKKIARLSGRFLPQPDDSSGGDWLVGHKAELFDAFEKLHPQSRGMYSVQKALSFGAGGTIFIA